MASTHNRHTNHAPTDDDGNDDDSHHGKGTTTTTTKQGQGGGGVSMTVTVVVFVALLAFAVLLHQSKESQILNDIFPREKTLSLSSHRFENYSTSSRSSTSSTSSMVGHSSSSYSSKVEVTERQPQQQLPATEQLEQQRRRGPQSQIHLSLGEASEAPSLYVTWSTPWPSNTSKVEVWREDEPEQNARVYHTQRPTGVKVKHVFVHKVHVPRLEPQIPLYYSVVNGKEKSPAIRFQVYERSHFQLPVAIFGDLGVTNAVAVPALKADVQKGKFKLAVHAGDIAYTLKTAADAFLKKIEPIASRVPYHVIPGNHDVGSSLTHLRQRFTMPGGQAHSGNQYHSFDFGGIHFTMISTEIWHKAKSNDVMRQYKWIESDLREASKPERKASVPFIVVVGHRPMYCSAGRPECKNPHHRVRTGTYGIERLLKQYNVDMYFAGHVHAYERSFPVYNDAFEEPEDDHLYMNPNSTVHITIGNAGSKWKANTMRIQKAWSARQVRGYGYGRLTALSTTELLWEYVEATNRTVADSVRIRKT